MTFWPTNFETFPPPGAHIGSHPDLALRLPSPRNRTARERSQGGALGLTCVRPPGWAGGTAPGELELAPLEVKDAGAICGVGWGGVGAFAAGGRAVVLQNKTWHLPAKLAEVFLTFTLS